MGPNTSVNFGEIMFGVLLNDKAVKIIKNVIEEGMCLEAQINRIEEVLPKLREMYLGKELSDEQAFISSTMLGSAIEELIERRYHDSVCYIDEEMPGLILREREDKTIYSFVEKIYEIITGKQLYKNITCDMWKTEALSSYFERVVDKKQ